MLRHGHDAARDGCLRRLGSPFGRTAGPLAQATQIARLREIERGQNSEADDGGEPRQCPGLLDHVRYVESQGKAPSCGLEGGH